MFVYLQTGIGVNRYNCRGEVSDAAAEVALDSYEVNMARGRLEVVIQERWIGDVIMRGPRGQWIPLDTPRKIPGSPTQTRFGAEG